MGLDDKTASNSTDVQPKTPNPDSPWGLAYIREGLLSKDVLRMRSEGLFSEGH